MYNVHDNKNNILKHFLEIIFYYFSTEFVPMDVVFFFFECIFYLCFFLVYNTIWETDQFYKISLKTPHTACCTNNFAHVVGCDVPIKYAVLRCVFTIFFYILHIRIVLLSFVYICNCFYLFKKYIFFVWKTKMNKLSWRTHGFYFSYGCY